MSTSTGIQAWRASTPRLPVEAARRALQTHLAAGNPPDTWQSTRVTNSSVSTFRAVTAFPSPSCTEMEAGTQSCRHPARAGEQGGEVYAVLVGVHRANVLWYNKRVLEKHRIKVGETLGFKQFFSAAQKLEAAGLVPLAMGDAGLWATAALFENTLLGVLGPHGWQESFGGEMKFDDSRVKQAIRLYGWMLGYQNVDHSALSWARRSGRLSRARPPSLPWAIGSMGNWSRVA
jgi:glucose/mannose transport system substrate-binding protein